MENDIPKIDLPQDWVIGKLSIEDIGLLNLYANYPCPKISNSSVEHFVSCWNFLSV